MILVIDLGRLLRVGCFVGRGDVVVDWGLNLFFLIFGKFGEGLCVVVKLLVFRFVMVKVVVM